MRHDAVVLISIFKQLSRRNQWRCGGKGGGNGTRPVAPHLKFSRVQNFCFRVRVSILDYRQERGNSCVSPGDACFTPVTPVHATPLEETRKQQLMKPCFFSADFRMLQMVSPETPQMNAGWLLLLLLLLLLFVIVVTYGLFKIPAAVSDGGFDKLI